MVKKKFSLIHWIKVTSSRLPLMESMKLVWRKWKRTLIVGYLNISYEGNKFKLLKDLIINKNLKSVQNGLAYFNYFLLWNVHRFISKIINVMLCNNTHRWILNRVLERFFIIVLKKKLYMYWKNSRYLYHKVGNVKNWYWENDLSL